MTERDRTIRDLLDGIASDQAGLPLAVSAVMFAHLLEDLTHTHHVLGERALWAMWSAVSELLTQPEIKDKMTGGQRLAAMLLTEYFGESGDWKAMQKCLAKTACQQVPGPIVAALVHRLREGCRERVEKHVNRMKEMGKWPPL